MPGRATARMQQRLPLEPVETPGGPAHPHRRPAPFLKWAGGKSQLLEQMAPHLPTKFGAYYEPFLGGGALYFHLQPSEAVLSDSNKELINTYRVVRDKPRDLIALLDKHAPHGSSEAYFKRVRSTNPSDLSDVERAARLVFLNKTCFNGLYRVNSKGKFNTPFGHYRRPPRLYDTAALHAASQALKGKSLAVRDYKSVGDEAQPGDFVYFDPPYVPLSKTSSFTGYTKNAFGEKDQEELAALFDELAQRGCLVALSNSSHDTVLRLYEGKGYRIVTLRAKRAINCKGEARGAVKEFLLANFGAKDSRARTGGTP